MLKFSKVNAFSTNRSASPKMSIVHDHQGSNDQKQHEGHVRTFLGLVYGSQCCFSDLIHQSEKNDIGNCKQGLRKCLHDLRTDSISLISGDQERSIGLV